MSQIAMIVDALKSVLRQRGITYADIAKELNVAEVTIKRTFSSMNFTLERLEQVCDMLDMDITDLLQVVADKEQLISSLSYEQEKEIISDMRLAVLTHSLMNNWSFDEIIETYDISYHQGVQYLAQLDRMQVIRLLPHNRVRMRISRNFRWLEGGPIEQFIGSKVKNEFFQSSFKQAGERFLMVHGLLSRSNNQELCRRMQKLVDEFNYLHAEDTKKPIDERFGSSLVVALRHWEVSDFTALRRKPNSKVF